MAVSEKHLEMIQAVISRTANNSFSYKGWSVAVCAALIAFFLDKRPGFVIGAIYPVMIFWYLDAYNLAMERSFRRLYDAARLGKVELYAMDISVYRRPIRDQIDAMLSSSLIIFYGLSIACILVLKEWK